MARFSRKFVDITGFEDQGIAAVLVDSVNNANATSQFDMVYTGVVPIVYKAQTELLSSLINSIGLAFVMIAVVMIVLLRNGKLAWNNFSNVRGGLVSMIPNVFPVILVFGLMGHFGVDLDIGSMMTASVAMGVAVDDTVHFLTWFRKGLNQGMQRHGALMLAYERCAAAMTQTTLIGGLGLSVFALSSFTPTQRFGVLMLTLLAAALLGDLIFLPAILSSPLGKYFSSNKSKSGSEQTGEQSMQEGLDQRKHVGGPHGHLTADSELDRILRHDKGHKL
jgi:predicted RND superfamily exporter protein